MEEDISDVGRKSNFAEAGEECRPEGDLDSLFSTKETLNHINQAAAWAGWKYRKDPDDLWEIIVEKLYKDAEVVTHLSRPKLRAWCFTAVKRHCLNEIRHAQVHDKFSERTQHQATDGVRHNGKPLTQSAEMPLDRELLKEEIYRDLIAKYPEWLVRGWASDQPPREIAADNDVPVKTVYGLLRAMQKYAREKYGSPRV